MSEDGYDAEAYFDKVETDLTISMVSFCRGPGAACESEPEMPGQAPPVQIGEKP